MTVIKAFTLLLLMVIFLQDLRTRAVYWLLFPLLLAGLLIIRIDLNKSSAIIQSSLINSGFLLIFLLILTLYFSLKNKEWVNITNHFLGLGDILFLWTIAFYLSVLNFLFFYMSSLVIILAAWPVIQLFRSKKNKYIPLAGLQSLIFSLFLASDWWFLHFDLTNDTWLLNLISK